MAGRGERIVTTVVAAKPTRSVAPLIVKLVFLFPFGWELLGAISNLLAWLGLAERSSATLTSFALAVLVVGIVIPVAAYALAVLILRRKRAGISAIGLAMSYCASQALTLSLIGLFYSGIGTT
jgi:hypothetical protein